MAQKNKDGCGTWIGLLIAVLFVAGIFLVPPYYEARTFNKFRKDGQPEATYWDALFCNLRVNSE